MPIVSGPKRLSSSHRDDEINHDESTSVDTVVVKLCNKHYRQRGKSNTAQSSMPCRHRDHHVASGLAPRQRLFAAPEGNDGAGPPGRKSKCDTESKDGDPFTFGA